MVSVNHYTSVPNYDKIKMEGILPIGRLSCLDVLEGLPLKYRPKLPQKTHVGVWFSLLPDHESAWKIRSDGLWSRLMDNVIANSEFEFEGNLIARLNVSVPDSSLEGFDYGILLGHSTRSQISVSASIKSYLRSGVSLKHYEGKYKAPELVCSKPVSSSQIKLVEIFEHKFNEM